MIPQRQPAQTAKATGTPPSLVRLATAKCQKMEDRRRDQALLQENGNPGRAPDNDNQPIMRS